MNFGVCTKADSQEIIEIDAIETLSGTPECPHCHQPTLEEVAETKKPKGFILGAIGGVVVIAAVICFFMFGNKEEAPAADKPSGEKITEVVGDTITRPDSAKTGVIEPAGTEKAAPEAEKPVTETDKEKTAEPAKASGGNNGGGAQTSTKNGYGTVNLGYGRYTGDLKNGQPHGHGTITYTQSHKIVSSKDFVANPGDTFEGDFRDGRISSIGYWTHDGNQTAVKP